MGKLMDATWKSQVIPDEDLFKEDSFVLQHQFPPSEFAVFLLGPEILQEVAQAQAGWNAFCFGGCKRDLHSPGQILP